MSATIDFHRFDTEYKKRFLEMPVVSFRISHSFSGTHDGMG